MALDDRATRWQTLILSVTIHMAASLDGFIARKDGRVDWLETSDEFADGDTLDPGFIETFLKTIDCYVMGSRTYETALSFEAKGFGWSYGDKLTFVLTSRDLPRTRDTRRVLLRRSCPVREWALAARVPYHLVCWRRCSFWRMPSSRASRRSSLFDSADLDWRWNTVLREARQRHRSPSCRGQSLQERHGGALLRGARPSCRATQRRHLTSIHSNRGHKRAG
jgi:hypothetical protein